MLFIRLIELNFIEGANTAPWQRKKNKQLPPMCVLCHIGLHALCIVHVRMPSVRRGMRGELPLGVVVCVTLTRTATVRNEWTRWCASRQCYCLLYREIQYFRFFNHFLFILRRVCFTETTRVSCSSRRIRCHDGVRLWQSAFSNMLLFCSMSVCVAVVNLCEFNEHN